MSKASFSKVSVSLPDDILKVVEEFTKEAESTRSAVIADLLRESLPMLQISLSALRELKALTDAQRAELKTEFDAIAEKVEQQAKETGADADAFLKLIHKTKFGPN